MALDQVKRQTILSLMAKFSSVRQMKAFREELQLYFQMNIIPCRLRLVIFQLVLLVVSRGEAETSRRYDIEGTEGQALLGAFTFLNLTDPAMHIGRCLAICLQECQCISFQICKAVVCQLCSTTPYQNPEALRKADECSYFVLKNAHVKVSNVTRI